MFACSVQGEMSFFWAARRVEERSHWSGVKMPEARYMHVGSREIEDEVGVTECIVLTYI